ncbi:uncharacterized protein V1510DRAFT_415689 [Dipodascopsis tothii]|uniref:uncharacterized protein n=1 Tax=Dipodascopsis tothii TaxID=44089 RepID=UPI0034CE13C4
MGFLTDHPYTAITVSINNLVTEDFAEDELTGLVDLIETIRLSPSGPTEAARAVRKKLKYGTIHNQLRALTILDGLIENGGKRFQASFADEPLLERMRILAADPTTNADVKKKLQRLFVAWAIYKDRQGMQGLAQLHRQLPQRKRAPQRNRFEDMAEDMDDDDHDRSHDRSHDRHDDEPSSSTRRRAVSREPERAASREPERARRASSRPSKSKKIDLVKEKPRILQTLAEANSAATNLSNQLKLINREEELASDNEKATELFDKCRLLRRQVLRYIQQIESEEYIGTLLHANDELVAALQLYDRMSREDSDSDYDSSESESEPRARGSASRRSVSAAPSRGAAWAGGLRRVPSDSSISDSAPARPARPTAASLANHRKPPPIPKKSALVKDFEGKLKLEPRADPNDPFADANTIDSPAAEHGHVSWKEV